MKKLRYLLIVIPFLLIGPNVFGQVSCPIPCYEEQFPYVFCMAPTGAQQVVCSSNPDSMPSGRPAKSHIPGCVNLVPEDTGTWYQPSGDNPPFTEDPPDKEIIWEQYLNKCADSDYDLGPSPNVVSYWDDPDVWGDDESAWTAIQQQWEFDSSNFFQGLGWQMIDTTGLDDAAQIGVSHYFSQDYENLFATYDDEYGSYQEDSEKWAGGLDQPYAQIWNTGGANGDAQGGIDAWINICSLSEDKTCCILITADTNINHFNGNYQGIKIGYPVAYTYGHPTCPDPGCPSSGDRYIIFNATNSFYYQNQGNIKRVSTEYLIHPFVPLMGWYTANAPDSNAINQGFSAFSFKEVIEHEEGHWLGLLHPDSIINGDTCVNNINYCKKSIPHYWMLMGAGQAQPNIAPRGLGADDSCMFEKLYCPGTGLDPVAELEMPEPASPELFPNPTTGACQLQYQLLDRQYVQIGIYNELGTLVSNVSSDYENEGEQTISLGTENLPSGNYVCRVRVGDRVNYINLEIRK